MKTKARLMASVLIVGMCIQHPLPGDDGDGPSINELESEAVEHRQQLTSGQVDVRVTGFNEDGPFRYGYRLWFDERYVREELIRPYGVALPEASREEHTSVSIIGPDRHFRYSNEILQDGTRYALAVDDRLGMRRDIWKGVPNPKLVGVAGFNLNQVDGPNFNRFLGNPRRDNVRLRVAQSEGVSCQVISFIDRESGVSMEEWIAPARGPSVVRLTAAFFAEGKSYFDDQRIEVQRDEKTRLWLPVRSRWTRTVNDKPVSHEDVRLAFQKVNAPLDARLLEMNSMKVPLGTRAMYMYERRGAFEWDGEQLRQAPLGTRFSEHVTSDRRLLWIIVAMNLLLLAAVCIAWPWWRRRYQS